MQRKIVMLSLGLVGLLAAGTSQADLDETNNDWKSYNGAFCSAGNNQLDVRVSVSGIANWESSAVTVYCPVVRDVAKGGPNRVEAAVRLFNNHSRQGGSCTLVSRDINNKYNVEFDRKSWPAGYKDQIIRLGPINSNNWGSYIIYCSLPPAEGARKSVIRSVAVDEQI